MLHAYYMLSVLQQQLTNVHDDDIHIPPSPCLHVHDDVGLWHSDGMSVSPTFVLVPCDLNLELPQCIIHLSTFPSKNIYDQWLII